MAVSYLHRYPHNGRPPLHLQSYQEDIMSALMGESSLVNHRIRHRRQVNYDPYGYGNFGSGSAIQNWPSNNLPPSNYPSYGSNSNYWKPNNNNNNYNHKPNFNDDYTRYDPEGWKYVQNNNRPNRRPEWYYSSCYINRQNNLLNIFSFILLTIIYFV
ncbi:unnamed protein product [Didymodactylos carnosus]|uniref:Uncharacterized protein n=1 Tax=Didymodactylos carnosus TaxID=1234261 RepID=A0A815VLM8_9BILA|nr:unnamed protein product [Didymodactylos carnosus]CAF1533880.1 unnamed protein product [Didymodactylos carnosus]CAF4205395.1 unnamed protein product [Didymodactylos carnosus]CAF4393535.1 unnamed protein product [Didymodactylos carnosus]